MKKVAVLAFVIVFLMSGCMLLEFFGLISTNPLLGAWLGTDLLGGVWAFIFNEDMTFTEFTETLSGSFDPWPGDYSFSSDEITLTYDDIDKVTLSYEIDGDTLSLSLPLLGSFISISFQKTDDFQPETVATPSISVSGNEAPTTVTITTTTSGADIYYTLDETDPDPNDWESELYDEPFEIYADATIRAIASKSGFIDSEIQEKSASVSQEPSPVTIISIYLSEDIYSKYLNASFKNDDNSKTVIGIKLHALLLDVFGDLEPNLSSDYFLGYVDSISIGPGQTSATYTWYLSWQDGAYSISEYGVNEVAFSDGSGWEDYSFTP